MFIRSHGFTSVTTNKDRDVTVPKGIWVRQRGARELFMVRDQNGKLRSFTSVDDAIVKQSMSGDDDYDASESDHADQDEGNNEVAIENGDNEVTLLDNSACAVDNAHDVDA